jgi:hypothetical protein
VETLSGVQEVLGKIEAKMGIDALQQRSTQKGRSFEELLHAELDAIYGPFGDDVRYVGDDHGATPGSKAGDYVISLNPLHTGGKDIRLVVEAKTGKLTRPKSMAELDAAARNRDAVAGVLVFDGAADAPLGGRRYADFPDGRFIVVLDADDPDALSLDVACRQARFIAVLASRSDATVSADWIEEQCTALRSLLDEAHEIQTGLAMTRRGTAKIEESRESVRAGITQMLAAFEAKLAG